jgi:hypothetical protein
MTLSVPYQGLQSSTRPVGAGRKSRVGDSGLPFIVDWNTYFVAGVADYGVILDCSQGSAPLDIIKSAYIDNSENLLPVTLQFIDTGYSVTIEGGAQAWLPVYSMMTQGNLIINGMTTGFESAYNFSTSVLFLNVDAQPFVNKPGGPVVADDTFDATSVTFTIDGSYTILPAQGPGFLQLNSLKIDFLGGTTFANGTVIEIAIPALGTFAAGIVTEGMAQVNIVDYQDMAMRISAAANIVMTYTTSNAGQGQLQCLLRYTYPVP